MITALAREQFRQLVTDRPMAVTIGVFDGVHRGHQALIRRFAELARERDLATGVIALHPAPITVIRPDVRIMYISSLEERLELLRSLGVDAVGPLTFTSELAQVSAEDFIAELRQTLDMRLLAGGPDISVGRAREGNAAWLAANAPRFGFELQIIDFLQEDGDKVGSSGIREAVARGDMEGAADLLGRPFSLRGPVVRGFERGRTIGFPTANIAVSADRVVPVQGVYVSRTVLGENRYPSVTNIGTRPTFDDGRPSIETHLLDFESNLYGRDVKIELLHRLRGEQRFDSVQALVEQIGRDVEAARAYHSERAGRGGTPP
jgi:riboflavin kinase / FMN adenylyltransferase